MSTGGAVPRAVPGTPNVPISGPLRVLRRLANATQCRSGVPCQRSDLNAAAISVAKSSGSSQAAKWPPLSTSLK